MTDDISAISGEREAYVPCDEVPVAVTASGQDSNAVYGDDEGFVALANAASAESTDETDTSAVFGRMAGYVPGPCDCSGTLICSPLLDYTDIDLDTTWRPVGGLGSFSSLIRRSHVPDGSPPSGPATFFNTDGPFWENPVILGEGLSGLVVPTWFHDGFGGDPWTIQELTGTNHLSWLNPSASPCIRVTGDLVVALAWGGSGTEEAELVAPAITWELCIENYGTLDVQASAFNDTGDPAVRTLDDVYLTGDGYFPTVLAAGTAGLGSYPISVTFTNPGTTYLQLMLRISNDTTATVAVFDRAFATPPLAAYEWPRYPDYLTDNGFRTLAGSGGMAVSIDNFEMLFCT
jgi:hypothetical protein